MAAYQNLLWLVYGYWITAPFIASSAIGQTIEGVQPAAIDQPRINLVIRRAEKGSPLSGESMLSGKTSRVEAFLDTGASGVVISSHTADLLGIRREMDGQKSVRFDDVGVGGSDQFEVSEPLMLSMAPYSSDVDVDQTEGPSSAYKTSTAMIRAQIGPIGSKLDDLLSALTGDLDVVGTPATASSVIVLDTGACNAFGDTIHSYLYPPQTRFNRAGANFDPGIPDTRRHVRLSMVAFAPFTQVEPRGAAGPAVASSPMIGPDPLKAGSSVPPVIASHLRKQSRGTWLLDTGAAASMISLAQARALGVEYAEGTFGTENPKLTGVPADKQFTMTVGGIGGAKKAAGFYIESLTLASVEGQPIVYKDAPVLLSDITIEDPTSKKRFTLDGVFGMNFLVATAKLSEGILPDIDHLSEGPYKWVVIDQKKALLGLDPTDAIAKDLKP